MTMYPMYPTATGYDLTVKPPPRHRAVMSEAGAWRNLAAKAGIRTWEKRGAHYAPLTGAAAWAAEEAAQVREILRVPR